MSGEHAFNPEAIGVSGDGEQKTMPVLDKDGRTYLGQLVRFDEATGDPIFAYLNGEKRVPRKDWEQYKKLQQ